MSIRLRNKKTGKTITLKKKPTKRPFQKLQNLAKKKGGKKYA